MHDARTLGGDSRRSTRSRTAHVEVAHLFLRVRRPAHGAHFPPRNRSSERPRRNWRKAHPGLRGPWRTEAGGTGAARPSARQSFRRRDTHVQIRRSRDAQVPRLVASLLHLQEAEVTGGAHPRLTHQRIPSLESQRNFFVVQNHREHAVITVPELVRYPRQMSDKLRNRCNCQRL